MNPNPPPSETAANRVLLDLEGLHCAGCVARVETALTAVPGVREVHVNLALKQASVMCPSDTPLDVLIATVDALGFHATAAAPPEAAAAKLADRNRDEAAAWLQRLLVSAVLLALLIAAGHLHVLGGAAPWCELLLATALQIYVGGPYLIAAAKLARRFSSSMDTLVALGTGAAYLAGVHGTLTGDTGMKFMDAGMILTFITCGKYLEARAKGRASRAILRLLDLTPPTAVISREGRAETLPLAQVSVGELLIVAPGEKIPLDAEVTAGQSEVNEAWLTGESLSVEKSPGVRIYAGTINGQGSLQARVTKPADQTTLAQVIDLVRRAQESKADVQRLADRVVAWFVPVVLALAVVTLLAWGGAGHWTTAVSCCVAVLVVACPCALGLAAPTAVMVGSGRGAEAGILIKDARSLEIAGRLDTIVLDKTGTLTLGRPEVVGVLPAEGITAELLLATTAAVERLSRHPLAHAVLREAERRGLELAVADHLTVVPGLGVEAHCGGHTVCVGNESLLETHGVTLPPRLAERLAAERDGGRTVLLTAIDGQYRGALSVADVETPESREAVQRLRQLGLRVLLLSGDHAATAQAVGARVGVDEVLAELRPDEKHAVIEKLRQAGHVVAMVGDGINDAPALAAADLGIAIGTGADVAIETADVVLVRHDLRSVVRAVRLSRATLSTIRQNLVWAFCYNVLLLPLAAGVGILLGGWPLPPPWAAAAMALSSVSVVANSLLLRVRRWD